MPTPRYDMTGVLIVRQTASGWEHLQLRRAPDDYMGGQWSLCRGRCEGSENSVQAALRELREETGLAPAEFYRLSTLEQFYLDVNDAVWHVPFFVAVLAVNAHVTLNEEHDAFRWIPDGDIESHLCWAGEYALVTECRRFIFQNHPTKLLMRIAIP